MGYSLIVMISQREALISHILKQSWISVRYPARPMTEDAPQFGRRAPHRTGELDFPARVICS